VCSSDLDVPTGENPELHESKRSRKMINKLLSPLGFAALFILGASATAYSDSLPGVVAQPTGGNATCVFRNDPSAGDNALYNFCGGTITVWAPLQSRTTGNFRYFATAPSGGGTVCTVFGKDFFNSPVFALGPSGVNGNTQIGGTSFGVVGGTTTIFYRCTLLNGGSLQSINSQQF